MMEISIFLEKVIDHGLEAVKASYARPEEEMKLAGAVNGFEICRGKKGPELAELLKQAQGKRQEALNRQSPNYWFWRCREAEIEWVLNVTSAGLMLIGFNPIITPSVRGMRKAEQILKEMQQKQ